MALSFGVSTNHSVAQDSDPITFESDMIFWLDIAAGGKFYCTEGAGGVWRSNLDGTEPEIIVDVSQVLTGIDFMKYPLEIISIKERGKKKKPDPFCCC